MMKLQTPVSLEPAPLSVSYNDRIAVVGSCFADEIGARLSNAGFQVLCNPFGTLYNPVSIGNAIARLASGAPFTAEDVVEMGAGAGKYCSFWHHTSFARATPEAFLENANARLAEASAFWKECNRVIVTLGTAWAFRFEGTGETVANCLKRPAAEFTRYRLAVSQTAAILQGMVQRHAGKQFIFTVSPIRHMADGAHGNQLSKSTLLLAIEQLLSSYNIHPSTYYFPAYEIVLDELRDYRFFDEKMTHPTDLAVDVVWERFQHAAMTPAVRQQAHFNMKQHKREQHIPLHPSSDNN